MQPKDTAKKAARERSKAIWARTHPEKVADIKRRWAERNRERRAQIAREWDKRHPDKKKQASDNWRKRNPEKTRAYKVVSNALQAKRLVRGPCEVCGAKAHAHFDDYSKPLEVRWLCNEHSRQARKLQKDSLILIWILPSISIALRFQGGVQLVEAFPIGEGAASVR